MNWIRAGKWLRWVLSAAAGVLVGALFVYAARAQPAGTPWWVKWTAWLWYAGYLVLELVACDLALWVRALILSGSAFLLVWVMCWAVSWAAEGFGRDETKGIRWRPGFERVAWVLSVSIGIYSAVTWRAFVSYLNSPLGNVRWVGLLGEYIGRSEVGIPVEMAYVFLTRFFAVWVVYWFGRWVARGFAGTGGRAVAWNKGLERVTWFLSVVGSTALALWWASSVWEPGWWGWYNGVLRKVLPLFFEPDPYWANPVGVASEVGVPVGMAILFMMGFFGVWILKWVGCWAAGGLTKR